MFRSFRYPLHPTQAQAVVLEHWLAMFCDLYNGALQERRDAWRRNGESIGFNAQQRAMSVRTHRCPACGLTLDRDHNAALNILALGRSAVGLLAPPRVTAEDAQAPLPMWDPGLLVVSGPEPDTTFKASAKGHDIVATLLAEGGHPTAPAA